MQGNRQPEKGPLENEKRLPTDHQFWDLHDSFRGCKCNQSNSHQQNLPTSVGQNMNNLQQKKVTLLTSFVLNSRRASWKRPPSAPPNDVVQQKGDHGLLFHYATTLWTVCAASRTPTASYRCSRYKASRHKVKSYQGLSHNTDFHFPPFGHHFPFNSMAGYPRAKPRFPNTWWAKLAKLLSRTQPQHIWKAVESIDFWHHLWVWFLQNASKCIIYFIYLSDRP